MLIIHKTDPRNEPLIERAIPLVDRYASQDQFKQHIRTHRQGTRDVLPGTVYAGMLDDCSGATRNTLMIEVREYLMSQGVSAEEVDDLDFADCYDYVRDQVLQENDGKSCQHDFWDAAWGVYCSAMLKYANEKPMGNKNTTFGDLFD